MDPVSAALLMAALQTGAGMFGLANDISNRETAKGQFEMQRNNLFRDVKRQQEELAYQYGQNMQDAAAGAAESQAAAAQRGLSIDNPLSQAGGAKITSRLQNWLGQSGRAIQNQASNQNQQITDKKFEADLAYGNKISGDYLGIAIGLVASGVSVGDAFNSMTATEVSKTWWGQAGQGISDTAGKVGDYFTAPTIATDGPLNIYDRVAPRSERPFAQNLDDIKSVTRQTKTYSTQFQSDFAKVTGPLGDSISNTGFSQFDGGKTQDINSSIGSWANTLGDHKEFFDLSSFGSDPGKTPNAFEMAKHNASNSPFPDSGAFHLPGLVKNQPESVAELTRALEATVVEPTTTYSLGDLADLSPYSRVNQSYLTKALSKRSSRFNWTEF